MADLSEILAGVVGFEWDEHNAAKIHRRRAVLPIECEEVLSGSPRFSEDPRHSTEEARYFAFGATRTGRRLAVVFTVRAARFRVVSARDQSRRERREVEHAEEAQADSEIS